MANRKLKCRSCGTRFVCTTAEQDFYLAQGFSSLPNRCRDCMAKGKGERSTRKILRTPETNSSGSRNPRRLTR